MRLHPHTLVPALTSLILACSLGCSSAEITEVVPGAETDGGAGPGNAPDASSSPAEDAGADAGPQKRTGTDFVISSSAKSCDEVCAQRASVGSTCGKACPKDAASVGTVSYSGGEKSTVATCADKPEAQSSTGKKISQIICCCESPYIKKDGPSPPVSCDEVCAKDGLVCAPDAPWNQFGKTARAGGQVAFRSGQGSTTYGLMGCAAPPPATKKIQNTTFNFERYSCGCSDGPL